MKNPIDCLGIDHIVLRSNDVPAMLHFYENVMGARVERTLEDLGLHQLRVGQSLIDIVDCAKPLGQAAGNAPDRNAPNMDHLCLLLTHWEPGSLTVWLDRHGIKHSTVAQRYGAQGFGPSLYVEDPDGNTIELKEGR